MRTLASLLAIFLLRIALPGAWAESPSFTVECQMVLLPAKVAIPMLPEFSDDGKFTAAWPHVQELIARGEVTVSAVLTTHGTAGQKITAESFQEMRYPTEFEPPQLPSGSLLEPPPVEVTKNWPITGITPTAFETRNVGQSLQIEVVPTANPAVFNCAIDVSHVRFEQMAKIDAGRLASGEHLFVEQPYFSVMRDQTNFPLEPGKATLVGLHRLPGAEPVFEMFVLTLRVPAPKTP